MADDSTNRLLMPGVSASLPDNPLAPAWQQRIPVNPIGTQRIADQSMSTADPGFQPGVNWGGSMVSQPFYNAAQGVMSNALGWAGSSAPGEAALIPAWRVPGHGVFSSPEAATHQAAWNLMPEAFRSAAVNNAGSAQKVFVDETGKVLDRRQAFDYAMDNDLLHPAFVRAFKNAAGDTNPYAELTAEMLKSGNRGPDPAAAGTPSQ
jgi:hypothetical protein